MAHGFSFFSSQNSVSIRCVLSPSGNRPRFQVWPFPLTSPLPGFLRPYPLIAHYAGGTPRCVSFSGNFFLQADPFSLVPILYLRFLPAGSTSVSSLSGTTGTLALMGVTIGGTMRAETAGEGHPD